MKRLFRRIATVLTAIFLCVLLSGPAWAQLEPRIQVLIDGVALQTDVDPVIENGRTLVPLRAIFEALGASVEWDDVQKIVNAKKGDLSVRLQIGNMTAFAGGKEVKLEVPPKILNGRTIVPVRFVSESLGARVDWDDASRSVLINTLDGEKLQPAASAARISQLAVSAHNNFRELVLSKKTSVSDALLKQRDFMLAQPEVKEATIMSGNLFVRFTDGYELLMLMGEDTLGSTPTLQIQKSPSEIKEILPVDINKGIIPELKKPFPDIKDIIPGNLFPLAPCSPRSNEALIFDCLEDDLNVLSPKIALHVHNKLAAAGYVPVTKKNNEANLANAALIDNGEYGIVFMRGHGGVYKNSFIFLVRPWYTNPPPMNSGYTGTIICSAYNHAAGATQFGYAITDKFASTYWADKEFPATMFFLESCHGTDPGGLSGMPTWTLDRGASAWVGWDGSVSFNCGDKGSKLFFEKIVTNKNIAESLAAVHATGCEPPVLKVHRTNSGDCRLADYQRDPDEPSITNNGRDFKLLRTISSNSFFFATVTFYAKPNFDEFFMYISTDYDAPAEILVRCHPASYDAYKETTSGTGLFDKKIYSGSAIISGNNYSLTIPIKTVFGNATANQVWLYDMTSQDRLPDPPILF